MKALKYVGVVLLIGAAFVLGLNFDSLVTKTVDAEHIVIEQEWHDWKVHADRPDKPVSMTLFVKNQSQSSIDGTARFKIELNTSELEAKFIESLVGLTSEEAVLELKDPDSKWKAIQDYVKRGNRLLDGHDYEKIDGSDKNYTTMISTYLRLEPGESKRLELEFMIPPAYRGYALSIRPIDD